MKKIVVKKNQKRIVPVVWTGKQNELDYTINLSGKEAEVAFLMLLVGESSQAVEVKTTVNHLAPHTKSRVIIKGVLTDSAKVNFEGLVKIEKGAKLSKAWLAAHLLLLSPNAGGVAVPNLEIDENDVVAGHAATVGKIDELQLFYLMSRGLGKEASTRLIIQGFLQGLLKEFPKNELKMAKQELKWI
jgi:Fe-S cluster assembly protein SufD